MAKKLGRRTWEEVRRSRRWSEAEGRWVVAELQRSGLSAKQFAERHRVMATRVYHWCSRLRGEERHPSSPATPRLVEVELPETGRKTVGTDGGRIEIELLSGRRLGVSEAIGLERLSALVAMLERH
jgi:hypothetical protein